MKGKKREKMVGQRFRVKEKRQSRRKRDTIEKVIKVGTKSNTMI